MSNSFKKFVAFVVLAALPFLFSGCSWSQNTNDLALFLTGASGSGSSTTTGGDNGTSACVKADRVRVGFFSIDNCQNPPSNGAGYLPVGCVGVATATPKLQNGDDQPEQLHSSVTAKWTIYDNLGYATVIDSENSFNKIFRAVSVTPTGRPVRVEVDVCGVVGSFSFEVR